MGKAKVVSIRPEVVIDGFSFLADVVRQNAEGEEDGRKVCPVCGNRKNSHTWVCSTCVETVERPGDLIRAAKEAVKEAGGYIPQKPASKVSPSPRRLEKAEFQEVYGVAIGWLKENPEANENELGEALAGLFPDFSSRSEALLRAVNAIYKRHEQYRREFAKAVAAAKAWLEEYPDDKRHPGAVANDILFSLSPEAGIRKLTVAVAAEQERLKKEAEIRKAELWIRCQDAAYKHYADNPRDYRHPGVIAKELGTKLDLPLSMLTCAFFEERDKRLAVERARLVAAADKRRVKKPGSAARRGKKRGQEKPRGGGKKRGVKCRR